MPVPALSAIEQEVVVLVADGHSRREIAAQLGLSVTTVEWHVARASRKLEDAASMRERILEVGPAHLGGRGER